MQKSIRCGCSTGSDLGSYKKLIIIVGCQRSGTTLLGQILGAPSNAVTIDENEGLYDWFEKFASNHSLAEGLFAEVLGRARKKYLDSEKRISIDGNGSHRLTAEIHYLVLKAPNLTYSFREVAALEIPATVVYMVRDPRAVVASMAKFQHIPMVENQLRFLAKYPDLQNEFAAEIARMADQTELPHVRRALMWQIKSSLHDRFAAQGIPTLVLKYEDLIANTEEVCKKVAAHAQIPFDAKMLSHGDVFRGLGPGSTKRNRPIESSSMSTWSKNLKAEAEKQVNEEVRETMSALGYNMGDPVSA